MKKAAVIILLTSLLFSACSKKKEPKLQVFASEAFAYQMGDSSEVDATARVSGFLQNEKDGMYSATLGYSIDLVTPKGDTVKSMINKIMDKTNKEKISEIPIEIQFDLDSTFAKGNYKLIFNIKDVLSDRTAAASAGFTVGE